MRESATEVDALQRLLDVSRARATDHLRGIITEDRALSASNLVDLLTGMKVLSLATVTATGAPRISAVDGHFLHGTWMWSTSGSSAKARHLEQRPAVSVAHVDHEELAVFAHGRADRLASGDVEWDETLAYLTDHYGGSPLEWGDDIRLYHLDPTWMVGYAFDRERVLARHGSPQR